MKKVKLILIDDHASFVDILNDNLNQQEEFESIAVNSIHELYNTLKTKKLFDILLLDLNLQEKSGFEVIEYVNKKYDYIKILVLSGEIEANTVKIALSKKVHGFVSKTQKLNTIIKAIKNVYDGNTFICSKINEIIYSNPNNPFYIDITRLTRREKQILKLIGSGFDTDQISQELELSSETIKTHRKNIRNKLNLHSYGELIKFAVENRKFLN